MKMYYNDSNGLTDYYRTLAAETPVWFHSSIGVMLLIGTLGSIFTNGLVLIVFAKDRKLLTRINTYIVILCSLAIIMAIFGVPMVLVSCFKYYWFWGEIGCRYYAFLISYCGFATMLILTAISVERYIFVVRNNLSARLPKAFKTLIICVCMGVPLVFALCPLLGWNQFVYEGVGTSCAIDLIGEENNGRSFVVTLLVVFFLIPVSVMTFSYGSLYAKVLRESKARIRSTFNNTTVDKLNMEKELSVTILLITGLFLLCWAPYAFLLLWKIANPEEEISAMAMMVPSMLTKVGGMFTPLVYVMKNHNFRKQALNIFRCRTKNSAVHPNTTLPNKIQGKAPPKSSSHQLSSIKGRLTIPEENSMQTKSNCTSSTWC